MKTYNANVRFEFKLSMHGYGKDVKKALINALQTTLNEVEAGDLDGEMDIIEENEVIDVIETDTVSDEDLSNE